MTSIRNFIAYLRLFYHHTRWRFPLLYMLIAAGGFIEAIGIVALLPLLNIAVGDAANDSVSRTVVDVLASIGIASTLTNLLLVIVVLFSVRGMLVFLYTYYTAKVTVVVRRNIQIDLIRRICAMGFPYYIGRTTGWFNNIIVGEVHRFISSLRAFSRVSLNVINALVFLPFAISLKPDLTLMVFIIGGAFVGMFRGFIRNTAKLSHEQTGLLGRLNGRLIEFIQAFIYLKATNSMEKADHHVIDNIGKLAIVELRMKRNVAVVASVKEPVAVAVLSGFIYYEVSILGGSLSEVMVVSLLLYRMLIQLVSVAPELQAFNQTIGGVFIVDEVSRELENHAEQIGTHKIDHLDQPIEFRNVNFQFGDAKILHDINIVVRPNETVGIVGPSGAGKTTFFHLLTGLLVPTSGEVTIGTESYSELDKRSFRERIGYVTQEPVIFNDTVANNISMWQHLDDDEDSQKRLRAASQAAKCDSFVDAMEKGFDSMLGERGIKLSGGERQRIAIARELFKDPELLIFDEAASALDAESERYVQDSINSMHGLRTVVVITHRLASVRNCDHIYVFDAGNVVEEGTFKTLYTSKKSYFRRLCDQQGVSI